MYGRDYGDKTLNFEPSGGLINATLVMQDKETDSYWSIMTGDALSGELEGTRLVELPVGVKAQWKDWLTKHPETLVLSIEGIEHEENNHYEDYFTNDEGFRGLTGADDRLATKEPIYSFKLDGRAYAVPHSAIENGAAFEAGEQQVFLFRPSGVAVFYSTVAWVSSTKNGFEQRGGVWYNVTSNTAFDSAGGFEAEVERLGGFDTYWYSWSLLNPETEVLK